MFDRCGNHHYDSACGFISISNQRVRNLTELFVSFGLVSFTIAGSGTILNVIPFEQGRCAANPVLDSSGSYSWIFVVAIRTLMSMIGDFFSELARLSES